MPNRQESAKKTLQALNPGRGGGRASVRLQRRQRAEFFSKYDLIVDGSHNFGTR